MYCAHCGKPISENARFCGNCGTPVRILPAPEQETTPVNSGFEDIWDDFNVQYEKKGDDNSWDVEKDSGVNRSWEGEEFLEEVKEQPYFVNTQNDQQDKMNVTIRKAGQVLPKYLAKVGSAEDNGGSLRQFYVVDFIVRMVTVKENIPICIYLIMNVLFMGVVMTAFTGGDAALGMLLGLIFYIISITAALSPFGEWLLRKRVECVPIQDQAIADRLYPLFNEVYANAKRQNPGLPDDIKLFINDDESPNAFATGRRTVCITKGMLNRSDEQIKGTLGHEFGHLSHKDTDRILVINIGNSFVTIICLLAQIGAFITEFITHIMAIFMGEDGIIVAIMASLGRFFTIVLINAFLKIWTGIGNMLCMKTSRGNEYQADEFSCRLGYGNGLISVLQSFGEGPKPQGLFAALAQSHPATEDRITRMRFLMNNSGNAQY